VTATNQGTRALHQVRAVTESTYDLFSDREFVFGRLDAGQSRSWTVEVEVPKEDVARIDQVKVKAFADQIDLQSSAALFVQVNGQARPHFAFSYWIDDSEGGNGDGLLQVGESVKFLMTVHNTGEGAADRTQVAIRNKSESAVFITTGRSETPAIAARGTFSPVFEFTVRAQPPERSIKLDAEVYDTVYREFLRESLLLPVGTSEQATPGREATGSLLVSAHKAPIYAGASDATSLLAEADKDAVLTVRRARDGWYFVTWDGGSGWVPEAAAQFRPEPAPSKGTVTPRIQFQAPFIDINAAALRTSTPSYTLNGVVSDDNQVRDLSVLVYNQTGPMQFRATKRAYQAFSVPSTPFRATVPLREGFNRIMVVARDNDKATTTEVIYVYRSPAEHAR
jgi:carboxyl-terminal processing protease